MSHVSQNHLPSVTFIFLNVAEMISIIVTLVPLTQYFVSSSASGTDTLFALIRSSPCVLVSQSICIEYKESNLIEVLHTR